MWRVQEGCDISKRSGCNTCKLSPISYHDHGMGVIGKKSRWQLTFPMLVARLPDSNLHVSHD